RPSFVCNDIDTMWVQKSGLDTPPCPYCQIIHLRPSGKYRASADYSGVSELKKDTFFTLPPLQEWYYKNSHPEYRPLPPFKSSSSHNDLPLTFIKPEANIKISIPDKLDGKKSAFVAKAAHRNMSTTLYWHIDKQYRGKTKNIHTKAFTPQPGKHTITIVDEKGNSVTREFEVIE
ncbi:MAG: hypothetical protein ABEH43_09550, partial [Flavobacteriales bacterium]